MAEESAGLHTKYFHLAPETDTMQVTNSSVIT